MFLNGYKKDALAMWVLGRAYEAADQRGLTSDYRQMCLDRLDYMIRCMGGSSVWLVGHLGSLLRLDHLQLMLSFVIGIEWVARAW